jgi:hypothetical protein
MSPTAKAIRFYKHLNDLEHSLPKEGHATAIERQRFQNLITEAKELATALPEGMDPELFQAAVERLEMALSHNSRLQ